MDTPRSLIEYLIDSCVRECYFRELMAEIDVMMDNMINNLLLSHRLTCASNDTTLLPL